MAGIQQTERTGIVTFKGAPVTLVGPAIEVGDQAPSFSLVPAADPMGTVTLANTLNDFTRAALLIVVPSIDTSVCALETVRFNREVANVSPSDLGVYTISVDLPFAQKRWTTAEHVSSVQLLSDYKTREFGTNYGVLIKELALYARSIFIVDRSGIVRYVEVVAETALEPNYQRVLDAAKSIINQQ